MNKYLFLQKALFYSVILVASSLASSSSWAQYPEKRIRIVVYTKPGGLIDITSRKIAQILQDSLVDVPVVVENRKGAGGLSALYHVIRSEADGYTWFGLTSSVLSKTVKAKREQDLEKLSFIKRVALDYEALLTLKSSSLTSFSELLEHAKQKAGRQLWVGPAAGGTDYLFAHKVWRSADIAARWIPYKSGGQAIAALLGGHGDVYVGNAQDQRGREQVQIVAVAAPHRLKMYEDVPTFKELGYPALTGETLWRGFAVHEDVENSLKLEIESLLDQAVRDPRWLEFVSQGAIDVPSESMSELKDIVSSQIQADQKLFKNLMDTR